jgi:hypothetical protein
LAPKAILPLVVLWLAHCASTDSQRFNRRHERVGHYGSEPFLARVGAALGSDRDARDVIYAERFACRPPLAQVIGGKGDAVDLDRQMWVALERYGYTAREIGQRVGRPAATVWRRIRRAADRGAAERGAREKIEI